MSNSSRTSRSGFLRAAPYAIVGIGAGALYAVAARIAYPAREGTLGPDFWPKLVLALIIIVCVYEIVRIVVLRRRAEVEGVLGSVLGDAAAAVVPPGEGGSPATVSGERHPWLLLGGIAITVAYVALVQRLGFALATVVYLATFIAVGGYRRWGVIAAVSTIGTLAIMFFFMRVVYVSLPLGQGVFQQVSLALMQLLGVR